MTQPAHGTVEVNGDGSELTYRPDGDYCNTGWPTDDFTYTLNGGSTRPSRSGSTAPTTPRPPSMIRRPSPRTTRASPIDVLGNDAKRRRRPARDRLRHPARPRHRHVAGAGSGLTYRPDGDYCNSGGPTDDFTYKLNGGSEATVKVGVDCADDAPSAVDDQATVAEDDPASPIDVLGNDVNDDGGPLEIASATQPAHGTVTVAGDGSGLSYRPNGDYCNSGGPTDDFTYKLNGGSEATVKVGVDCADDAPSAVDDQATVAEDDPASPIDVLGNDVNDDGGPLEIASATQPAHGTVTVAGDGSGLSYRPNGDYCNTGGPTDDFTYKLNGGSEATVKVGVDCADDAPSAVDDQATVAEDDPASPIDVLGNDENDDGGPLEIASATQPAHGTVTVAGDGSGLSYRPNGDYCNSGGPTDDFTYKLNGGSEATVKVAGRLRRRRPERRRRSGDRRRGRPGEPDRRPRQRRKRRRRPARDRLRDPARPRHRHRRRRRQRPQLPPQRRLLQQRRADRRLHLQAQRRLRGDRQGRGRLRRRRGPRDDDRLRPLGLDQRRHPDLRLLLLGARLELPMPLRLRPLRTLLGPRQHPHPDQRPRLRRPRVRGPRHRSGREQRPDPGESQLHGRRGRPAAAAGDHSHDSEQPGQQQQPQGQGDAAERRDAEQRQDLHERQLQRHAGGQPHAREVHGLRDLDRSSRQRDDDLHGDRPSEWSNDPLLEPVHLCRGLDRPRDDDRLRPLGLDQRRHPDLRLLLLGARLELPMPPRLRPLRTLLGPRNTHTPTNDLASGAHVFEVRATDPAANSDPTPASRSFTVEGGAPPPRPVITATTPSSPANNNSPKVKGTLPSGGTLSNVKIYTNGNCSGTPAANRTPEKFTGSGISIAVPDNATTTFTATVRLNGATIPLLEPVHLCRGLDRPRDDDRLRPLGLDQRRHPDLRLLLLGARLELPMPPSTPPPSDPARAQELPHPDQRPRLRRARVQGPRHRPGREQRPEPGESPLQRRVGLRIRRVPRGSARGVPSLLPGPRLVAGGQVEAHRGSAIRSASGADPAAVSRDDPPADDETVPMPRIRARCRRGQVSGQLRWDPGSGVLDVEAPAQSDLTGADPDPQVASRVLGRQRVGQQVLKRRVSPAWSQVTHGSRSATIFASIPAIRPARIDNASPRAHPQSTGPGLDPIRTDSSSAITS